MDMKEVTALVDGGIAQVAQVSDLQAWEVLKAEYLGKTGKITALMKGLGALSIEEKKTIGAAINVEKQRFQDAINQKRDELNAAKLAAQLKSESLDVTLPGRGQSIGGLHPVTNTLERVVSLFTGMGFEVADGPEIEQDFYNFQALNIPEKQPTRAKKKTIYMKNGEDLHNKNYKIQKK